MPSKYTLLCVAQPSSFEAYNRFVSRRQSQSRARRSRIKLHDRVPPFVFVGWSEKQRAPHIYRLRHDGDTAGGGKPASGLIFVLRSIFSNCSAESMYRYIATACRSHFVGSRPFVLWAYGGMHKIHEEKSRFMFSC